MKRPSEGESPICDDLAVLHRDHGRARLRVDASCRRSAWPAARTRRPGTGGKPSLKWAAACTGKRASVRPVIAPSSSGGRAAEQLRAQHHRFDVGLRVVVGEDRRPDVRVAAGGPQVAGGGEDRVGGVVGVLEAVAVGVHPVLGPLGGQELHPALGARARDAQVAAVVGLDLVDRREHLPGDSVGGAGRLVDRQQERRDLEAFDEEAASTPDSEDCSAERQRRRERGRRDRAVCLARGPAEPPSPAAPRSPAPRLARVRARLGRAWRGAPGAGALRVAGACTCGVGGYRRRGGRRSGSARCSAPCSPARRLRPGRWFRRARRWCVVVTAGSAALLDAGSASDSARQQRGAIAGSARRVSRSIVTSQFPSR